MSEITRAYAVYKGQQYNASYDSGTQLWDVDIPSGSESSYGQVNHTYPIELHAFDAANNETIMYACIDYIPDTRIGSWIGNAGYKDGASRCRWIRS